MVGFGDRLRAWLRGEDAPGPVGASGGRRSRSRRQHPTAAFDGAPLLDFVRTRHGVEVYLEPRTNLYGDSVLLVADDGEYLRRAVPDVATIRRFCSEHAIPVYDAARTGYPRRVRDYDRGVRPDRVSLEDLPPWPGEAGTSGRREEDPPPPPPTG